MTHLRQVSRPVKRHSLVRGRLRQSHGLVKEGSTMNLRRDQTHQSGTSVRRLAADYRRLKLGPPPPAEAPPVATTNYVLSFGSFLNVRPGSQKRRGGRDRTRARESDEPECC